MVFFYWPEAVLGNFYWPRSSGLLLASSPDPTLGMGKIEIMLIFQYLYINILYGVAQSKSDRLVYG